VSRKNYHPIRTCTTCGFEKRINAMGRCFVCYRKHLESTRPGYRAARLQYMREYKKRAPKEAQSFSKREAVHILAQVFGRVGVSCEDLLAYIHEARRRNKCNRPSSQSSQPSHNPAESPARTSA